MPSLNKFLNIIDSSLILLTVPLIRWFIIIVVILYNITAVPQINNTIEQWFRWIWFRLFYMLVILYVGYKDKMLALLLGISFTLSLHNLSMSQLENTTGSVKPYVEQLGETDNDTDVSGDVSGDVSDNVPSKTDGTNEVTNANEVHDKSAYSDYLNSQFDDPLGSFKNLNQCNSSNDIAVTDKDKEILENPCSLNKD